MLSTRSMRRLPQSLVRRSWWWVFALFMATPAMALSLLGLSAIRADEIERQQRLREQQSQIARLADVALSTALNHELSAARDAARGPGSAASFADITALAFEIDASSVVSFPAHRVYVTRGDTAPVVPTAMGVSASAHALVEAAQRADLQGRSVDAVRLYERLRGVGGLQAWADLQLILHSTDARTNVGRRIVALRLEHSDVRSPAGIPLAIVASSVNEDLPLAARREFEPLIRETLRSLRQGRWLLSLDQRRAYDEQLRRWLSEIEPATVRPEPDATLGVLDSVAASLSMVFAENQRFPAPAQSLSSGHGRLLVIWGQLRTVSSPWTGVALSGDRAAGLFSSAIEPLVRDQPFAAAVRDRESVVWGGAAENAVNVVALDSMPGWTLSFTAPQRLSGTTRHRLTNYARVLLPIVVLTCGLVMTGWIVRRELALTDLQSAFVAAVTHEFKSPITSIRLLMERIASGRLPDADSPDRYYAAISAETDRLESLVNRLLEVQQLQTGQKEHVFRPTDLDTTVRDAVDRMRPQAESKAIELALHVDAPIPRVALDADSISDSVRNLVDNAIKYSPNHTRVDVTLGVADGVVRLTVADQGIGIDPADCERIFRPFYRSRRGDAANVHGTGLGLALVKATAEAHGGSIIVMSDGQRGSCFTVSFPARGSDGSHSVAEDRMARNELSA